MNAGAASSCVRGPNVSRIPVTTQLAANTPNPRAASTVENNTIVAKYAFKVRPALRF